MLSKLLEKEILVLDGGLGTTIEDQYGIKFTSEDTPLWSSHLLISSPETLLKVQTEFSKAGADIILTATYQACLAGIHKTPGSSQWQPNSKAATQKSYELLQSAIEISTAAVKSSNHPGIVALSLGAYGATLIPSQEYTGEYGGDYSSSDGSDLSQWHLQRLGLFWNGAPQETRPWSNVDILAFETLPRLSEIRAVRSVMYSLASLDKQEQGTIRLERPYWISCVFPNEDDNLPDGSSIKEAIKAMLYSDPAVLNLNSETVSEMGASSTTLPLPYAIGINCTKVQKISRLVRKFEEVAESLKLELPRLAIYPDGAGGLKYDATMQRWVGEGSDSTQWDEKVFDIVKEVYDRGKWKGILVGGCCKTTPEHIKKLRKRLNDWRV